MSIDPANASKSGYSWFLLRNATAAVGGVESLPAEIRRIDVAKVRTASLVNFTCPALEMLPRQQIV
jgi:hypothetical protein